MNKNSNISHETKKPESLTEDSSYKKHSSPQTTKQLFQGKFIAVFVFGLLMIILIGLVLLKTQETQKQQTTVKKITINQQILQKRSKDLGFIQRGLTGKAVDVNTGKVVKAARIFSLDDKVVYLELDLNTAPKGTVIDYLRYKDGRYVDHGEVTLEKADIKNMLFNWTINALLAHVRDGKWKIATYTNGILAKRIAYEVQNNKVGYVYPDEKISPSDPDYQLTHVLVLAAKDR